MKQSYIDNSVLFILPILLIASILILPPKREDGAPLADQIIRLHVLANSDSDEDQLLKLELKEEIVTKMSEKLSQAATSDEIRDYISENSEELKEFSENFIKEKGYDYPVTLQLAQCYFPTKTYGDLIFPCGEYEALRIIIGKGDGKNWWCVLYPPLCFVDVTNGIVPDESKQLLENLLTEEDYRNLTMNREESQVTVKFKFLEFFK